MEQTVVSRYLVPMTKNETSDDPYPPSEMHSAASRALAAAEVYALAMPGRHGRWAVFTAGILVQRGFAAARVLLKDSNYAAYSAVMTLLVLLLIDSGGTPSFSLLADRPAATLAGCVLALTLGNPAPYRRFLA